MSLVSCIRKAGKALNTNDADSISSIADEIEASGVERTEAEKQAVEQHLTELQGDIAAMLPTTLDQGPDKTDDIPRGLIEILDGKHTISLSEQSDVSTFLHESMHLFASMEGIFAKEHGLSANQKAMLDHVGAKSFDELTVDQHETLAESFEVYLREGKAPSIKLANSFGVFRSWLTNLYKSLRNLPNQKFDPELSQIFDRLLATEAEIAEVAARPEYQELFKSKEQSGMTDAEWEKYQQAIEKRKSRATTSVVEKITKQLRDRKTKEWNEEKAPIKREEKERLSKLPVYQILSDTKNEPMDFAASKELAAGDKKLMGKLIGRAKKGGIDPEIYAEVYGYRNAQEMFADIANTESLTKASDRAAEAIMVTKHGDILNDGTIQTEVHEALHSGANAEVVLAELKVLNKRKQDVNRSLLKAGAKKMIGSMRHGEIKPDKFRRLEAKSALKAERATTDSERTAAKMQQLANHYLYKEATKVKADITKWSGHIDFVRKHKYNTRSVDAGHVQSMKLIANLYRPKRKGKDAANQTVNDLRNVSDFYRGQEAKLNSRLTMADPQLAEVTALIDAGNLSDFEFTYYEDLTADQLRSVYDNLVNMRFSAGKVFEDNNTNRQAIDKVVAGVKSNKTKERERAAAPYAGQKVVDRVKGFFAGLASLRNKVRKVDGFREDDQGASHDEIFLTVSDAHNNELDAKRKLFDLYKAELLDVHNVAINKFGYETITKTDGGTLKLHSEGRFMLALYWGTESSRKSIMDGHDINETDAMRMMSKMTEAELNLVNSIWKLNETMWEGTSTTAIAHHGIAPKKLAATPFVVNGVEMSGGHQTIYYDSVESDFEVVGEKTKGDYSTLISSEATAAKERVGSGGRMVYLSKDNITRAIDENIHYSAFHEASVKIAAIMNDSNYKNTIIKKHGEVFYKSYVKVLENITHAKPDKESAPALASFLKLIRRARTYAVLHYSIRNTAQQMSSVPIAMKEVGSVKFAEAASAFISSENRTNNTDLVNSKSKFMQNRAQLVNREAQEFLRQIAIGGKVENAFKTFTDHGFTMQTMMDSIIAYPTWLAKYNIGMAEHGNERVAISQADTSVAESVGSGADLHLGGMFQSTNTQLVKMVTQFGSWFNNYYQRTYRATEGYGSFEHKSKIFGAMVALPMIVAVMNAALTMEGPKDDEEMEAWLAKIYISHMAGMIPLVRDAFSAMFGWKNVGIISKAASVPADVGTLAGQIEEEKVTGLKATSKAIKLASTLVPMSGSGQITRIMDFIDSDAQGNEKGSPVGKVIQAVLSGPTRN